MSYFISGGLAMPRMVREVVSVQGGRQSNRPMPPASILKGAGITVAHVD